MALPTDFSGTYHLGTVGNDVLTGTAASDAFVFFGRNDDGPAFWPTDRIAGASGYDYLILQFESMARLTFQPSTMTGVEEIVLLGRHDHRFGVLGYPVEYHLDVRAVSVPDSGVLTIDATSLTTGETAEVTAAGMAGRLTYVGGQGSETVTGGTGDDLFVFGSGALNDSDRIFGGAGRDTLVLQGNYAVELTPYGFDGIEEIRLLTRGSRANGTNGTATPTSYDLVLYDRTEGASVLQTIIGSDLLSNEPMSINARWYATTSVHLHGGAGNDHLAGGALGDFLLGGDGADTLSIESGGNDVVYGGSGDDVVLAGDELDDSDYLELGSGYDRLILDGTYDALRVGYTGNASPIVLGLEEVVLSGSREGFGERYYTMKLSPYLNSDGPGKVVVRAESLASADRASVDASSYAGTLAYIGGNGIDQVIGTDRMDTFRFAPGTFGSGDVINGGRDLDMLWLDGGQSVTLTDKTFINIENILLQSGTPGHDNSYRVTLSGAAKVSGGLLVTGGHLRSGDTLALEAGRYAGKLDVSAGDGNDTLIGGAAGDILRGGKGGDFISIAFGGIDTVDAGDGDDGVFVGAALNGDIIDGGAGNDQLGLLGTYRNHMLDNITGFETVVLLSGFDTRFENPFYDGTAYELVAPDTLVAAGQRMIVNANSLSEYESVIFDGSRETDGSFLFFGGKGADRFVGGAQSDGFYFGRDAFGVNNSVSGGDGTDDQLGLQGNYRLTIAHSQMEGIESLVLLGSRVTTLGGASPTPFAYDITIDHPRRADMPASLLVTANTLAADETLRFDASRSDRVAYTVYGGDGRDTVIGGAKNDVLYGRGGDDVLFGGGGRDTLIGGAGADRFMFTDQARSSSGVNRDLIVDFDAREDRIGIVMGDDTHRQANVSGFRLSENSFDTDLSSAINELLEVGGVIVARAGSGDLAGHVFVIADQNGVEGYQSGEDLVIEIGGGLPMPAGLDWLVA